MVNTVRNQDNLLFITNNQNNIFCSITINNIQVILINYHFIQLFILLLIIQQYQKKTNHIKVRCMHFKTSFVSSICWSQRGRQNYFIKSLISLKLSHNSPASSQSSVQTSRECGVFSKNICVSILGTASFFGCMTRFFSFIWIL